MNHTIQLQTNETLYKTASKWGTLCKCKQLKPAMQLQKMKHIIELQTIEEHYATANK